MRTRRKRPTSTRKEGAENVEGRKFERALLSLGTMRGAKREREKERNG